jgi:hypothetical protein
MVEFIRADDRGTIFNQDIISPSQIMSLLTATLVILIILTNKILQKQKHKWQQKITN